MSMWTHITSCMSVETNIVEKKPELRRRVQKFLEKAPKITGSEGNALIFINIPSGYNMSVSHDCKHCKYSDTIVEYTEDGDDYFICDAPSRYNCSNDYQTCVVISVQGDLRDRTISQTKREFEKFKTYVEKLGWIRDYSVNIEGD